MLNGKKGHSSDVNNQNLEQMYMDNLEKFKIEACSVLVRVFSDVLVAFLYFDILISQWQISKYGKAT